MRAPVTTSSVAVVDLREQGCGPAIGADAADRFQRTLHITRWIGLGVLTLLQLADLVSTKLALHGGAVEANPITRLLITHGAINPTKFAVLGVLALCISKSQPRLHTTVAIWFVAGVYSMIVLSNLLVIAQIP